jgi:hypothetical protein
MTKLMDQIADAERRQGFVDRWSPMCEAAGFLDGSVEFTPEDLVLLAGAIMHDKEVARLRMLPEYQIRDGIVFETKWEELLESLGDDGRAALRSRINFQPVPIMRKRQ